MRRILQQAQGTIEKAGSTGRASQWQALEDVIERPVKSDWLANVADKRVDGI
jgi:hypothetical protein